MILPQDRVGLSAKPGNSRGLRLVQDARKTSSISSQNLERKLANFQGDSTCQKHVWKIRTAAKTTPLAAETPASVLRQEAHRQRGNERSLFDNHELRSLSGPHQQQDSVLQVHVFHYVREVLERIHGPVACLSNHHAVQ